MHIKFNVSGFYYTIEGYRFRKYLDIKQRNSLKLSPDIMVIMMNPGASRPIDGIDNNDAESEAIPDRTQDQIMKVMIASKLEYARVLNLTDIREPRSQKMFLKAREMDQKGIAHSIFDPRRRNEFNSLFIEGIPVIFAWGVGKELKILAEKAIEAIDNDNPIGLKKEGVDWAYYHPLPQNYNKQVEWVDKITNQLKNTIAKLNKRDETDNFKTVKGPIEDHISITTKFNSCNQEQDDLFNEWKAKSVKTLKAIGINCNPKEIICNLSENLLKHTHGNALKDSNEIHQHLMNYWNETMFDDCNFIASYGWSSKLKHISPTIKDFANIDKFMLKATNDLIPRELVINRYLEKEKLEEARLINDRFIQELNLLKEEHSRPDGYLKVIGKLTKANLKAHIKNLQGQTNVDNELKVMKRYLELLDRKNVGNYAFKTIEKMFNAQAIMRYPLLTEEEVKTLVVEDKWMGSLETAIKSGQTEVVIF